MQLFRASKWQESSLRYGVDCIHAMSFLVFSGRHTVLLPEHAVEAGVIPEAVFVEGARDVGACCNGLAAALKPFLRNVLVNGDAEAVLEVMGDVILGKADMVCQNIQRQILGQMLVNEQRDLLHQIPGAGNDGVFSFIYDAIHIEQQIIQCQVDGGIAPIAVGMKFLQKPDQTGLDGRKFCFVKMIIAAAGGGSLTVA